MPLIVDGTARFTVHQRMAEQEIANVIDMHLDDTTGLGRAAMCEAVAGRVLESWSDTFRQKQVAQLTCESVAWVDLAEADGSTGEVTEGGGIIWPQPGAGGGSPFPGGIAILVRKLTTGGRGTRDGRLYVAGASEAHTATTEVNTLSATELASWQLQADTFLGLVNSGETGYDATFVVVHRTDIIDVGTRTDVTALQVDDVLATQRRRQR